MKINTHSHLSHYVTAYLNGRKVEDAIEASEEDGYVWVAYRNAKGHMVSEVEAEPGAFIYEGVQVVKLTGQVQVKIDDYAPVDTVPFEAIVPTVK